mmetsp:Transcript_11159/g.29338  ORF Transcript_11159/g.29338 Transcript_11159/m.29338 type:complete len:110 (-) Transcript_11159:2463-2792(-)
MLVKWMKWTGGGRRQRERTRGKMKETNTKTKQKLSITKQKTKQKRRKLHTVFHPSHYHPFFLVLFASHHHITSDFPLSRALLSHHRRGQMGVGSAIRHNIDEVSPPLHL